MKNWLTIAGVAVFSTILVWLLSGPANAYRNFDGPLYLVVMESWYDKTYIGSNFSIALPLEYYPAHLPVYPALIWLTSLLVVNNFWAMLLTTLLGTVVGAILFYEIGKDKKWPSPWILAILWMFWWPRMWAVRSVGSPETWFMVFILSCLWMFEKKKYFWSGVFGAMAVWTKSPGVLLIPTLLTNNFYNGYKNYKHYIPVGAMILAGLGLFGFYQLRMGDFWAYFHTGDNIHLDFPFGIFDSSKPWVGNAWLEDVIWIYFISIIGIVRAWQKDKLWSIWGGVFLTSILFVSHRDIARYSLPLVPTVLLGFSDFLKPKWVKVVLAVMLIPLLFYTVNFVKSNVMPLQNWGEFI